MTTFPLIFTTMVSTEKRTIKNRKPQRIVVLLDLADNPKGLAFVMHGLGGFKEQEHIKTFADAFREEGLSVVRFDTTNTLGESDGAYEHATTTNYYEDLEDVIEWASSQEWYREPFWLCGHSLGGISTALFAQKHPGKVKALAPISTVVSGRLSMKAYDEDELRRWKETGWKAEESKSKPGVMKKLPWSHMEDRLRYDLLEHADALTMPVILIVGDKDDVTPPEHQKLLFDRLPGVKEMHIIKGAPHTFRDATHLEQIKTIMKEWIKRASSPNH